MKGQLRSTSTSEYIVPLLFQLTCLEAPFLINASLPGSCQSEVLFMLPWFFAVGVNHALINGIETWFVALIFHISPLINYCMPFQRWYSFCLSQEYWTSDWLYTEYWVSKEAFLLWTDHVGWIIILTWIPPACSYIWLHHKWDMNILSFIWAAWNSGQCNIWWTLPISIIEIHVLHFWL